MSTLICNRCLGQRQPTLSSSRGHWELGHGTPTWGLLSFLGLLTPGTTMRVTEVQAPPRLEVQAEVSVGPSYFTRL
jgi:hypothetical protein